MNSKESESDVRGAQAASNNDESISSFTNPAEMKRAAAQQMISKYFYQVTDGCGNQDCTNQDCASSAEFRHQGEGECERLTRNQLAVIALQLCKDKAKLCGSQPNKMPKVETEDSGGGPLQSPDGASCEPSTSKDVTDDDSVQKETEQDATSTPTTSSISLSKSDAMCGRAPPAATVPYQSQPSTPASTSKANHNIPVKEVPFLTEEKVMNIVATCKAAENWSLLRRTIGEVFCNPQSLIASFRKKPAEVQPECHDTDSQRNSETVTTQKEGGDKMGESSSIKTSSEGDGPIDHKECTSVDIEALRRTYEVLFSEPNEHLQSTLINAIVYLSKNFNVNSDYRYGQNPDYINIFVIVMEIPILHSPEYLDSAFPQFCTAMNALSVKDKARLVRIWSQFDKKRLTEMLNMLQQIITVGVMSGTWNRTNTVNDDAGIIGAVGVMKILYYACLCGGQMDSQTLLAEERELSTSENQSLSDMLQGAMGHEPKEPHQPKQDLLAKELHLFFRDCRQPLIPHEEFVNEYLNEVIEMDKDFTIYKAEPLSKFSFMNHPFILTTATKNQGMFYDNRVRMMNERRSSLLQSLVHGAPTMPYLRLRIRRDHVIDDALVGLEMAAMDNPTDLKKQLYVEFDGEQGIDEGGVSKEFFQLVVEEIFNPDFGMFTCSEETRHFWFNSTSFENDAQFTLIGIVLGLAIYNNIILDINFPMVVYRKLMDKKGTFEDMKDSHPVLYNSLKDLLEYDGNVEDDFMVNFDLGQCDVFGTSQTSELKENGSQTPVTNDNRKEYVTLYADFLLNKSIEKQFKAFKRGFQMVTDESPLKILFRPEELELLVCGSKNFDFQELENATEYDGGFTETSTTIRSFWEIVHDFNEEQKRQLLQFTTGSDRVPVGGLSKLKLIIARNGPDSDRLPTSHTCFNVLLLPNYSSKDKLGERLLKAITHAKGFGML